MYKYFDVRSNCNWTLNFCDYISPSFNKHHAHTFLSKSNHQCSERPATTAHTILSQSKPRRSIHHSSTIYPGGYTGWQRRCSSVSNWSPARTYQTPHNTQFIQKG